MSTSAFSLIEKTALDKIVSKIGGEKKHRVAKKSISGKTTHTHDFRLALDGELYVQLPWMRIFKHIPDTENVQTLSFDTNKSMVLGPEHQVFMQKNQLIEQAIKMLAYEHIPLIVRAFNKTVSAASLKIQATGPTVDTIITKLAQELNADEPKIIVAHPLIYSRLLDKAGITAPEIPNHVVSANATIYINNWYTDALGTKIYACVYYRDNIYISTPSYVCAVEHIAGSLHIHTKTTHIIKISPITQ